MAGRGSAGSRAALSAGRPVDLAAAARLPGVTPAALLVLLAHVKMKKKKKAKTTSTEEEEVTEMAAEQ